MRFLAELQPDHCRTAVALGAPAKAKEPGWCATYRNGGNNCGFNTHEQCMAAVSGVGGFCNRSPYAEPDKPAARKERKEREAEPKAKRKDKEEVKERVAPAPKPVPPPAAAQPAPAIVQPAAGRRSAAARAAVNEQLSDGARAYPVRKIPSRYRGDECARL